MVAFPAAGLLLALLMLAESFHTTSARGWQEQLETVQGKAIVLIQNFPRGTPPRRSLLVKTRAGPRVRIVLGNQAWLAGLSTGMDVAVRGQWLGGLPAAVSAAAAGHAAPARAPARFKAHMIRASGRPTAQPVLTCGAALGAAAAAAAASAAGAALAAAQPVEVFTSNPPLASADMSTLVVPLALRQADGGACPGTQQPRSSAGQVRRAFFEEVNPGGPTVGGALRLCSYGAARLTAANSRVTEVVALPCTGVSYGVPWNASTCELDDFSGWADAADGLLAAAGLNLTQYYHRVYLVPPGPCAFVGMAYVGCNPALYDCRAWINGDDWTTPQVSMHELGHHMHLAHAGAVDPAGSYQEYGDLSDMMGWCCDERCPNIAHAWQLGWAQLRQLDAGALAPGVPVPVAVRSQSNPAALAGPRGLRILPGWALGVDPIFVGHRSRAGGDAQLASSLSGRVSLYSAPITGSFDARRTRYLASLAPNGSWEDAATGLVVRYDGLSQGSVLLTVCRKAGPETPASCAAGLDADCNGLTGDADPACTAPPALSGMGARGSMDSGGFSFPALPKPKPLPPKNPLLAAATVTDRSAAGAAAAALPPPAAAPAAEEGGEEVPMGASLGKPVVLSRHHRIAPARKKVPFEKGFSQMDWVRLTQTHPDLAGLGGGRPRRDISMAEVAQHRTADDAWTVLRGKVYNVTHYMRFHPGGTPLILKVAGRDGTALFNKFHAWVNHDFLLAKCLVGLLAPPSSGGAVGGEAGAGGTAGSARASVPPSSSDGSSGDLAAADEAGRLEEEEAEARREWAAAAPSTA